MSQTLLTLGPFGQMPSLSTYTIITLGFSLPDPSNLEATLSSAANSIVSSFPWLAGQVVVDHSDSHSDGTETPSSGIFKIAEYEPHSGPSKFVHIKDCTSLCPSFAELSAARAPTSMIDGSIVSPAYGFGACYPEEVVKPVVVMQANIIVGGLLLTIATYHCVMDANGNETFILHFARLLRGEKLSQESIALGNADQSTMVPPLSATQTLNPLPSFRRASTLDNPPRSWPPGPVTGLWKTYRFTSSSIARLKAEASKLCAPDSSEGVQYISSNDALTAFIWTHLTLARALPASLHTTLYRAINGRAKLSPPISSDYMGHFIYLQPTQLPVPTVTGGELAEPAIALRRSLNEVGDVDIRSFFHLLKHEKDRSQVGYAKGFDPTTDLTVTSWVGQKYYEASFGVLGKPAFLRRPSLFEGGNLCYLMPATREGHVDLIAGLTEGEFAGLQKDGKWMGVAELIG